MEKLKTNYHEHLPQKMVKLKLLKMYAKIVLNGKFGVCMNSTFISFIPKKVMLPFQLHFLGFIRHLFGALHIVYLMVFL